VSGIGQPYTTTDSYINLSLKKGDEITFNF